MTVDICVCSLSIAQTYEGKKILRHMTLYVTLRDVVAQQVYIS